MGHKDAYISKIDETRAPIWPARVNGHMYDVFVLNIGRLVP